MQNRLGINKKNNTSCIPHHPSESFELSQKSENISRAISDISDFIHFCGKVYLCHHLCLEGDKLFSQMHLSLV